MSHWSQCVLETGNVVRDLGKQTNAKDVVSTL